MAISQLEKLSFFGQVVKSMTIAQTVLRWSCRSVWFVVTFVPDIIFSSLFYGKPFHPKYRIPAWNNGAKDPWDGSTKLPFFMAILSFITDVLTSFVGLALGLVLGVAVYTVDFVVNLVTAGFELLHQATTEFVKTCDKRQLVRNFFNVQHAGRSATLAAGTLGLLLASVFWTVGRVIESFTPWADSRFLSDPLWSIAGAVGTILGFMPAFVWIALLEIPLIPARAYQDFRNFVRKAVALLYAKTDNARLYQNNTHRDFHFDEEQIHSQQFRALFSSYQKTPLSDIILGQEVEKAAIPPMVSSSVRYLPAPSQGNQNGNSGGDQAAAAQGEEEGVFIRDGFNK